MYLLDTNIWLEHLLGQERSEEVRDLLENIPGHRLCVTDFSLHSIGLIMCRLSEHDSFLRFVDDLFVNGGVRLVRLHPHDMKRLTQAIERFGLDFDNAYQYIAAKKHGLDIVSYDTDFDKTDQGRVVPVGLPRKLP